jgi:RNA polymerase sigma factor (sigma-70 family)
MHETPRGEHNIYMTTAIQHLLKRLTRQDSLGEADALLLSRFVRDRDEAAFNAILERHGRFVWGVCRGLLVNEADAEDAFQATFVALFRGACRIRQQASLAPWLHATATRIARKIRLTAVRRTRRELRAARPESAPASSSDETWESLNFALHEEIARLPELLRTAFVMCVLEGKRHEEAAAQLGVPVGTLSARVSRARKKLLDRLRAGGLAPTIAVAFGTASATAAVPEPLLMWVRHHLADGFVSVPKAIRNLAAGGSSMTMKWIGALGLSGLLFAALATWLLLPAPTTTAAPAPKPVPDRGVIWVYFPTTANTATLTAYTPEGRKKQEMTLHDGDCYIGLTPDGQKLAFVGKGGKAVDSPHGKGLTVHLRDIGDGAEGTDTGIPAGQGCTYPVWSPDMKKAVYGRVTAWNGVIPSAYKYFVVDLASKKETLLDLPADFHVIRWSPDGKWLLGYQWGLPPIVQRYTFADGKLHTIVKTRFDFYLDLSPDGKTLIAYGLTREGVVGGPLPPCAVNLFDVETGTRTVGDKWVRKPEDFLVISRWSLDGKRVAHAVREKNEKGEEAVRIIVCDPDGDNEVKLLSAPRQFMGNIHWLPSPRKVAAPSPK